MKPEADFTPLLSSLMTDRANDNLTLTSNNLTMLIERYAEHNQKRHETYKRFWEQKDPSNPYPYSTPAINFNGIEATQENSTGICSLQAQQPLTQQNYDSLVDILDSLVHDGVLTQVRTFDIEIMHSYLMENPNGFLGNLALYTLPKHKETLFTVKLDEYRHKSIRIHSVLRTIFETGLTRITDNNIHLVILLNDEKINFLIMNDLAKGTLYSFTSAYFRREIVYFESMIKSIQYSIDECKSYLNTSEQHSISRKIHDLWQKGDCPEQNKMREEKNNYTRSRSGLQYIDFYDIIKN